MAEPVCYEDFRALAKARLPSVIFDYIEGGAQSETTLRRNISDFAQVQLRQRILRNVSAVKTETSLFGQKMTMPVVLAPVGMAGMFHNRGEVKAAAAAAAFGVPFCLSTVAVCSMEEVCGATPTAPWFQLYMPRDRDLAKAMLRFAARAGSTVLAVTVDVPSPAVRYRDMRSGLASPKGPIAGLTRIVDGLSHPGWLSSVYFSGRPHHFGNVQEAIAAAKAAGELSGAPTFATTAAATWDDIAWLRDHWPGQILIKGVLDPEDAQQAVAVGVEGIVVSNHGGRQLDGAPSSIAALPEVARAVGGKLEILMDSGVRTGGDVLKALSLGASACLLGRSWAYALGAGGQGGVARMLSLLHSELRSSMAMAGCVDVAEADASLVVGADAAPSPPSPAVSRIA